MRLFSLYAIFLYTYSAIEAEGVADRIRFRVQVEKIKGKKMRVPDGLDVAGQDVQNGTVDFIGTHDDLHRFEQRGVTPTLLDPLSETVDPKYLTPEKIDAFSLKIAEKYPHLASIEKIGTSLQNRPIYALRISSKDVDPATKPSLLINGMHHARELMTTEITTDILDYLTKNYSSDRQVRHWVDHLAIWVIPQLNPDGNHLVWTRDAWWRKNARGNTSQTWGVDINRNYPYEWGGCHGSSGEKSSPTYRGSEAASEPETQAIMQLTLRENMAFNISYHSYSELVISPYGCQGEFTPEDFILKYYGESMAHKILRDNGKTFYEYGTGWETLYPTDGEDISWMYHELNTLAYVIEVNNSMQGFQPDYDDWRDKTVSANRPGWQHLLESLDQGPQVRGRMYDAKTHASIDGSIVIKGIRYKTEVARHSRQGIYQKILVPGEYHLIFTATGYKPQEVSVLVEEHPLIQDVYFERASSMQP